MGSARQHSAATTATRYTQRIPSLLSDQTLPPPGEMIDRRT